MQATASTDMPVLSMTDEEFEKWRHVQDDAADRVAAVIMESPLAHTVYPIIGRIGPNEKTVHAGLFNVDKDVLDSEPEYHRLIDVLRDYYEDTSLFPTSQEDLDTIRRGVEFFNLHIGDCLFTLTLRSLLKQYAASRATYVLTSTRLLVDFPHRRIIETLQFVADVMDPDGMGPGGYTIRAIQNLRLVHAMVRYRINRKKADPNYPDDSIAFPWNDEWGAPINQQDMIFAVHTFSVEVLDGLKTHGVRLPKRMIDDYYHTWHMYGKALGVHDDLNPTTYEEGRLVQERIYKKEFKKNENGLKLTPPLIEFTQQFLPFSPSETHIYAMVKAYNNKEDYKPVFQEILGLPLNKAHIGWLALYFILDEFLHIWMWIKYILTPPSKRPEYVHRLAHHNSRMIQALVNINKTWSGKHFRIADGFGDGASEIDAKKVDTQPSFFDRLGRVFK